MKQKQAQPQDNVVRETNEEILDETMCCPDDGTVTECEIEREVVLLNPDPDSMESRG